LNEIRRFKLPRLKFYLWEGTISLGSNSVYVRDGEADVSEPFATELVQQGLAQVLPAPKPMPEVKVGLGDLGPAIKKIVEDIIQDEIREIQEEQESLEAQEDQEDQEDQEEESEVIHKCHICGKEYKYYGNLEKHIEEKH